LRVARRFVHLAIPLAITLAVPLAIYLINGVVEPWTFVLGAVIGFGVWYSWPF
jgi:hypothetical protein